jgi:hypothetical protein
VVFRRVRWRRPRRANYSATATQLVLCLRLALLKGESWLSAVTLDDSKTPTPVLHNTSVVVWNLYCVRVIIVRLNKRSKLFGLASHHNSLFFLWSRCSVSSLGVWRCGLLLMYRLSGGEVQLSPLYRLRPRTGPPWLCPGCTGPAWFLEAL